MDITKLKEISNEYKNKAEKENYSNDTTVDIHNVSSELIELIEFKLVGSEADILTGGEYTRRFENNLEELQNLLKAK